ncbi:uncharacterized protein FTOL_08214 [Fusarium torulosum]|uniref:Uncharacterized protein n=1 Tax=Fusarium torulosum TaxID=33205 RepID=A0AAE8SJR6_9HYPO|nr:uncharacterized protein FTOL_08214 [Fusarium torulosum]
MTLYKIRFCSFSRSLIDLSESLATLRTNTLNLIQLNNSIFVRTNTISIRRLDEQNSLEAEKLRVLTRKSAQDARDMKRLATLTMIFLPSTVVAAFFSTPFMSLDEGLHFKALSKVWILFLTSSIVTLLTFGVSWIWDAMIRLRQSSIEEESVFPQSKTYNSDKGVLEPEPSHFTRENLIDDILKAWSGSEGAVDDEDGGSSATGIHTRDIEESSMET